MICPHRAGAFLLVYVGPAWCVGRVNGLTEFDAAHDAALPVFGRSQSQHG